jgi:hypothetical protein
MPSPFPGMDPHLEDPAFWPGTHGSLIYTIRAALTPALPPGYYAEMDQYVWVQEADEEAVLLGQPDVYVANGSGARGPARTAAVADPTARTTLAASKKKKGNRFIRIADQADNRVVTVIELLSPSNKDPGDDRDNYLAKRKEYLATGTNLVEIDLLRQGDRIPLGKPAPPPADYYILVSRASEFPRADVWGFTVRDPIPAFPVPLKPRDGFVPLELRPCLDRAYEDAGYGNRIDYGSPPNPPLRPTDAEWASDLLKKHTRKAKQ